MADEPDAPAVNDWTLETVNTALDDAGEKFKLSVELLNGLVWKPTNNVGVDAIVQHIASMALAYKRDLLPESKVLVRNLQKFLEHYTNLTFDEFRQHIPRMIEESSEYAAHANNVAGLHNMLGGELVAVKEVVKRTGASLEEDKKAYQKEQEAHIQKLQDIFYRRNLACAIIRGIGICIDVVGGFGAGGAVADAANELVRWYCEEQTRDPQERANEADANLQNVSNASEKLAYEVSLCLCQFRTLLATLADFFTLLHLELVVYEDKLGMMLRNPVQVHYTLVKSKAEIIIKGCRAYVTTLSDIQINLIMIESNPHVTADRNILPIPVQEIYEVEVAVAE